MIVHDQAVPGPGLLVTIDGPGGAGKTTITELVVDVLRRQGLAALATTEPSRTELGALVRGGTDRYRGLTLACLVAADRYQHLELEVRPAVARGLVVVCDRYLASSLVLQRMDGVDEQTILDLARHVDPPDLAVILSARPEILGRRIQRRGAHSRWERDPASSALEAELFISAAEVLRARGVYVVAVDSSGAAPDEIANQIVTLIRARLDSRRAGAL